MAAGVALSVLPHLLWWRSLGAPVWIADHDDLYYLALGGLAYRDHPGHLADPVPAVPGPLPHRPLPFVPGILGARALGWGPMGVNLAWRIGAGLGAALGCFWALRARVPGPWVAAGLAVMLLADAGLTECRPLQRQSMDVAQVLTGWTGELLGAKPLIHPAWRILTPAATACYLWLFVGQLLRARAAPGAARVAAAGLAFGLLFYVYFYYWTAAGLGLVLAFALDAGYRRVYAHTAGIGGLVGLPAVIGDVLAKRATGVDWLNRTDKFLPIGHFDELLVSRVSLALLAVGLAWAWRSRRDLISVWSLAAAGFLLADNQVVTGLQIENFHWGGYVGNPVLELLLVLLVAGWAVPRLAGSRRAARVFGAVAVGYLGVGLWLRGVEAVRTEEPRDLLDGYRAYRAGQEAPGAAALAPKALTAGDPLFMSFAVILEDQRPLDGAAVNLSPSVSDAEWDERAALNDWLLWGDGPAGYEARLRELERALAWGPWARDRGLRVRWLAGRRALRAAIAADPEAALARYPVRYLALPAGRNPPEPERLGWIVYRPGGRWVVWERRPRPVAAAPVLPTD